MRGCQQPCPRGAEDENELRDTHCVPWCPASHLPWPRKLQGTWPGPWPSSLTSRVICGGTRCPGQLRTGLTPGLCSGGGGGGGCSENHTQVHP